MTVSVLPASGAYYIDQRGAQRALRVSWYVESRVVVLSLWQHKPVRCEHCGHDGDPRTQCVGTFRMPAAEIPGFVHALSSALVEMSATTDPAPQRDATAQVLLDQAMGPASAASEGPPVADEPSMFTPALAGLGRRLDRVMRRIRHGR